MAIQLTNSTVVKIIIRRGQNSDRKNIILSNGELGYVQDTQRLYIGDGVTYGGNHASNYFFGFTQDANSLLAIAENGDTVYDTSNETMFAFDNGTWRDVHPKFDLDLTFDKNGAGEWTLNENVVADPLFYNPYHGNYSLGNNVGKLDFNLSYLSLCANGGHDGQGSMYFGNIRQSTVLNKLKARVNIDGPLFVHDNNSPGPTSPKQIQFYSYYPSDGTPYNGNSTIRAVSGIFNIASDNELRLYSKHTELMRLSSTGYGGFTRITSTGGSYNTPNFHVKGVSRYDNNAWYDEDVTIYGNLSVFGESTYIETNITATSALSVINVNKNLVALHVAQLDPALDQTLARFISTTNRPVLTVKDGPFVGVNVYEWDTSTISSANFVVSGATSFAPSPGGAGEGFTVRTGTTGGIKLISGSAGIKMWGDTVLDGDLQTTNFTTGGLNAGAISCTSVNTNNGPITMGTGDLSCDTINSGAISCTSVNTNNGPITMGTGDLSCDIINSGVINCSSLTSTGVVRTNTSFNVSGTTITSGTGGAISLINIGDIGTAGTRAGAIYCTALNSSGDVVAFASSDRKLKLNITPIESALEKLEKINGVEFDWDEQAQSVYTGHDIGVIAQEVEEIIPSAVNTKEDGTKGVRYEKIIPLLVQAIKELNTKIKQ